MAAPVEKKQKTDGEEAKDVDMTAEKEVAEPPKEHEMDAKKPRGDKVGGIEFLRPDTTVNVMTSTVGNLLMSVQDKGFQYLLAGARASVGVKSGRYMFEVKIVESSPSDQGRSLLKIGFSAAGSSLLLDSAETSVCFDSEGLFSGGARASSQKLKGGDVVACLLNLEKASPNFSTISLFKGGTRISQPQALPDSLKGKPLFPAVAYKCMTLHMNFGPEPICSLPFKCHMVGSALQSDTEVAKDVAPEAGEVLFPVSLPDEGSFDWLDMYLEKNPGYIEISDRAIRDWAEKSAVWAKRGVVPTTSNDRPEMRFGVNQLDDGFTAKGMLRALCALQQRNYVVMEVKGNLVKEERAKALAPFKAAGFKTNAMVLVGPPSVEFKKRSQALTLKIKQEASDKEHDKQFEAEKRKWMNDKRMKIAEKARKKAAKDKEKADKKRIKAMQELQKKAAALREGKEYVKEEEKEEPEQEEPEEEEPEVPEPVKGDPPTVALTAEEKLLNFKPAQVPDFTPFVLNTNFTKFSLPDSEEGFDSLKYAFLKEGAKCKKFVEDWIASRKVTARVEEIKPSAEFNASAKAWSAAVSVWKDALQKYQSRINKRRAEKAQKEAKKKQAAAAKAKAEAEKKDGEDKEDKKEEAVEEIADDDDEEPEPEVDFEGIDIFGVDDVKDIGGGMPLYKDFAPEDWALMALAFELHLLGHSFKKDVKDEDRASIHVDNLDFYYEKYFKKALVPKSLGMDTVRDVVGLVRDVVYINGKGLLENCFQEELESFQIFVKIAEEARRFRRIRLDMGDESAVVKIAVQHGSQQQQGQKRTHDWEGYGGKGGWQQSWMPMGKKGKSKGW